MSRACTVLRVPRLVAVVVTWCPAVRRVVRLLPTPNLLAAGPGFRGAAAILTTAFAGLRYGVHRRR